MSKLASIIQYIYPNSVQGRDWVVSQDSPMEAPYISHWAVGSVPQPDPAQLLADYGHLLPRRPRPLAAIIQALDARLDTPAKFRAAVLRLMARWLQREPEFLREGGIDVPGDEPEA